MFFLLTIFGHNFVRIVSMAFYLFLWSFKDSSLISLFSSLAHHSCWSLLGWLFECLQTVYFSPLRWILDFCPPYLGFVLLLFGLLGINFVRIVPWPNLFLLITGSVPVALLTGYIFSISSTSLGDFLTSGGQFFSFQSNIYKASFLLSTLPPF